MRHIIIGSNLLFFLLTSLRFSLYAESGRLEPHSGYIEDVRSEREEKIEEVVFFPRKPDEKKETLQERIFDDKLTKEFVTRYEDLFGRTGAEQITFAPNRYGDYEFAGGLSVTFEQDLENRRIFAEYMFRRLTEYHIDKTLKGNKRTRPLYELKDRVSNLDLEVRKGYKFKINYSFSGNFLDLKVDNPYEVNSRLRLEMDPTQSVPGEVLNYIVAIDKDVRPRINVAGFYETIKNQLAFVVTRTLPNSMALSITTQKTLGGGRPAVGAQLLTPEEQRFLAPQDLILLGLSWTN